MAADAEATLPFLIEEVKRQMSAGRKSTIDARGHAFAEAHLNELNRSKQDAAYAWDNNPISMPRLCQELYNEIKNDDWSLVSASDFQSYWPQRLWNADRHHQYIGGWGAYGVGYLAPAGLGAALANQKYGRLSVSIVGGYASAGRTHADVSQSSATVEVRSVVSIAWALPVTSIRLT